MSCVGRGFRPAVTSFQTTVEASRGLPEKIVIELCPWGQVIGAAKAADS